MSAEENEGKFFFFRRLANGFFECFRICLTAISVRLLLLLLLLLLSCVWRCLFQISYGFWCFCIWICERLFASSTNHSVLSSILKPVIYKRAVFEFIALLLIQNHTQHMPFILIFRWFSVLYSVQWNWIENKEVEKRKKNV